MRRWSMLFAVAVACGIVAAATVEGASKPTLRSAKKILARLKLVDGPQSGLDADTVRGLKPLVVVDSRGAFVGGLMQADRDAARALVVRRFDTTPIPINVSGNGFEDADPPGVVSIKLSFESADCTGTPLLRSAGPGTLIRNVARVSGRTAYYANGSPVTRTVLSDSIDCRVGGGPLPDGSCCTPHPDVPVAGVYEDAVAFDLATLDLAPPFHIDLP